MGLGPTRERLVDPMTESTFTVSQRVVWTDPQTKQRHPGVVTGHDPNRQTANPERQWEVRFDDLLWGYPTAFCAAVDLSHE